jgi:exodeoxyribonuclease-3
VCGDFSITHTNSDVSKPGKKVAQRVGITSTEQEKLDQLIELGFSDTSRLFNETNCHHSWWSKGFGLEDRSQGWQLDYFFVNTFIRPFITGTEILACYEGSDHYPVMMEMELPVQSSSGTVKEQENPISQNHGLLV